MPDPTYVVEHLGNTTFVLRPEYDATVRDLGFEPPGGVPVECTFEWAWDAAEQKVAQQRRREARKAVPPTQEDGASSAKKAPAKKPPAKRVVRNQGSNRK